MHLCKVKFDKIPSKSAEYICILLYKPQVSFIDDRLGEVLSARQLLVKVLQIVADVRLVGRHKLLLYEVINIYTIEERMS